MIPLVANGNLAVDLLDSANTHQFLDFIKWLVWDPSLPLPRRSTGGKSGLPNCWSLRPFTYCCVEEEAHACLSLAHVILIWLRDSLHGYIVGFTDEEHLIICCTKISIYEQLQSRSVCNWRKPYRWCCALVPVTRLIPAQEVQIEPVLENMDYSEEQ